MKLALICDAVFCNENNEWFCNKIDYELAKKFRIYFDEIHIIGRCGRKKSDFVKLEIDGVYIKTVKSIMSVSGMLHISKIKNTIFKDVSKCDCVYSRGINGVIAQKKTLLEKKNHVTYVGGCVYQSMKSIGKLSYSIMAPVMRRIFRKSIERSDSVIYCTPYLQQFYKTDGKAYYWTAVKIHKCDKSLIDIRNNRIKSNKQLKIGLIGQVSNNVKGIDTALNALALLDNNVSLHILGAGDTSAWNKMAKSLEISDRVRFHGVLKGGQAVLSWLDDIDIYIQPSRTEGLPKASIEAESRGCPLVSSGVGGLSDITNKRLIHDKEDSEKLAYILKKLIDDRGLLREMSEYSLKSSEKFMPEKLDKVFSEICCFLRENRT